jgi:hypothetical protein
MSADDLTFMSLNERLIAVLVRDGTGIALLWTYNAIPSNGGWSAD